jgi:hypothetical protein
MRDEIELTIDCGHTEEPERIIQRLLRIEAILTYGYGTQLKFDELAKIVVEHRFILIRRLRLIEMTDSEDHIRSYFDRIPRSDIRQQQTFVNSIAKLFYVRSKARGLILYDMGEVLTNMDFTKEDKVVMTLEYLLENFRFSVESTLYSIINMSKTGYYGIAFRLYNTLNVTPDEFRVLVRVLPISIDKVGDVKTALEFLEVVGLRST